MKFRHTKPAQLHKQHHYRYYQRLSAMLAMLFVCHMALAQQGARYTLSGTVSESASGEAVIGVNVILYPEGTSHKQGAKPLVGTRTNKYGFYSLPNISSGAYDLVVRGVGYKTFVKSIAVDGHDFSIRVNIPLQLEAARAGQVTVRGARDEAQTSTAKISAVTLSPGEIQSLPAFGGEADVFRALQLMPGVRTGNEVSSGLFIRGGSPDQNLTLLDGVIVYNPTHLGGLLSVFNNDALRDTRLLKGALPAEYGGRLSSVIDITMKEGSKEKFGGSAGMSLLNARATVEGPISNDASFIISGRRLWLDIIASALNEQLRTWFPQASSYIPSYFFYDLNAKVNYKVSDNDRLYISGYWGYDLLKNPPFFVQQAFDVAWGNSIANLRWNHIFSPTLFLNFQASFTNYDFRTDITSNLPNGDTARFGSLSRIRDWAVRGAGEWTPSHEHLIKFGVEALYHQFRGATVSDGRFAAGGFTLDATNSSEIQSLETAIYLQDEWQVTPSLNVNAGARGVWFQNGNYAFIEPRMSASYAVSDEITVRGSFAQANQFIHLIIRNDIGVPSDVWFPSTERVQPARGQQYVLGGEYQSLDREWLLSIEGYYKYQQNLLEFKDDAQFSLLAPTDDQLTSGSGEAYGVEVFLNKRLGQWTGWIGYTLSWAWRTFPDLNEGRPFHPRFDRRHDIACVVNYKHSEDWEFGCTWVYQTGQAFTMPIGQFDFVPLTNGRIPTGFSRPRFQSTQRNGFRLPAFHKLDLTATHKFSWLGLPWSVSLSIYNAYSRANPFVWNLRYRDEVQPDGSRKQIPYVEEVALIPFILPTLGIGLTF
ncbi:MAG: TonB-dependent receptor [Bacteroidota bacterium]|nr:TonB-dependent receptor [Candidatus Kapabacteria bacterium]MDW8220168.1 TonB-dependent receptor [Bacteroidota bacterium]